MKILFVTSSHEGYLADSMLHGLRTLYGSDCVDYPKADILYKTCPVSARRRIRGRGFTLYSPLEDVEIDRSHVDLRISQREFDLILFSDIWTQFGLFTQWRPMLSPANTALMDGHDQPQVYPIAKYWLRHKYYWFLPRASEGFLYFKREWTAASKFTLWHRLFPRKLWSMLPEHPHLRPISFSIPREKIVRHPTPKTKQFAQHLVDPEVAPQIETSSMDYVFATESEYYQDLQGSRFSVTIKRAGWDCLRHYEIAANGCVPCIRQLRLKPSTCAPHGFIPGRDCLEYESASDLFAQVNSTTESRYADLQQGALNWAHAHTTESIAATVIQQCQEHTSRFR